jgi:RimJ/RimL family protein N-acetyltransferase
VSAEQLVLTDGVVVLRDWTATDADQLFRWLGPHQQWRTLDAPYLPSPTPERQGAALRELRSRASRADLPTPREGLVISDETNRLLGEVTWYWCRAVRRLDFATWSGNVGMLRIGQRLGFVEEGRFREARVVDGVPHDAVVMGGLRREWPLVSAQQRRP